MNFEEKKRNVETEIKQLLDQRAQLVSLIQQVDTRLAQLQGMLSLLEEILASQSDDGSVCSPSEQTPSQGG